MCDKKCPMKSCNCMGNVPKLREPDEDEKKKFNLYWHQGGDNVIDADWSFQATDEVWALANYKDTPTYRLYYKGTNGMIVLKYDPPTDMWSEISIEDIPNLYGFIWKMIVGWGWRKEHNA
jgi:hypothetical protein